MTRTVWAEPRGPGENLISRTSQVKTPLIGRLAWIWGGRLSLVAGTAGVATTIGLADENVLLTCAKNTEEPKRNHDSH